MDTRTNLQGIPIISFSDEGTGSAGFVDDVRDPSPGTSRTNPPAISTASLPYVIEQNWSRIATANISLRMYRRIVRLGGEPAGWRGPGSRPLRYDSLNKFLDFWMLVREIAEEPELALAPDGSLHAEWLKSDRQRLDVRFAEPKIFFGLFTGSSVLEGAENLSTVATILKLHPSKPLAWRAE